MQVKCCRPARAHDGCSFVAEEKSEQDVPMKPGEEELSSVRPKSG